MHIENDLSIFLYNARRAGFSSEAIASSLRARAEAEEAKSDQPEDPEEAQEPL